MPEVPAPSLLIQLSSVLQALAAVAVVLTFVVYWRQLRTMQAQLLVLSQQAESDRMHSKALTQATNALHLSTYLHSPEIYRARAHLLGTLADKPYASWTEADKTEARRAIGAYDIGAILAKGGAVPLDFLTDNWDSSILSCHSAARAMIDELRAKHGLRWWDDFIRLSEASREIWNPGRSASHGTT